MDCVPSFVSTGGKVVPNWDEVLIGMLGELGWRHLQVAPGKEALDKADATANMHHHNGDGHGLVDDVPIIMPIIRPKLRSWHPKAET